ncbi:MAG: transposase [Herbaspirillum sp.]|nr:transposase [Herbaspirillum sp.]
MTYYSYFLPLLSMNKYIQDSIRNNLRSIVSNLKRPQQKAIQEVVRGLFTVGTPVLKHLAQDETKTAKKQGEKYSYHLGKINLVDEIEEFSYRKTEKDVQDTTIISYDLSDINKDSAKKMAGISKVFDGSKRKVANGYTLHGVCINNKIAKLNIHKSNTHTLNQVRKSIVKNLSERLDRKGIWVFDRGNDHKHFIVDLRHEMKVHFIVRLKSNRQIVIKKTGELIKIEHTPIGRYEVYLMNKHNTRVDMRCTYTLIVKKHLKDHPPIRLLTYLHKPEQYTDKHIVNMYLERWGIENIFKRTKTKFDLEKVRVLDYQKLENIVALIQFVVNVSTLIFYQVQQKTNDLIASVLLFYKKFMRLKSLTFNIDSFISYLRDTLHPLVRRKKPPSTQLSLFSRRALVKLGLS